MLIRKLLVFVLQIHELQRRVYKGPNVFLQGQLDVILPSHLAQDMPMSLSTGMYTSETPCLSPYCGSGGGENTRVKNGLKYVFLVTNMDVTEGALFRVDELLLESTRNF